jgi:hypothetical protein
MVVRGPVVRDKKEKKRKGCGLGCYCWAGGAYYSPHGARAPGGSAGRLGQNRPSSVRRPKLLFFKILFYFSYFSFRPPK